MYELPWDGAGTLENDNQHTKCQQLSIADHYLEGQVYDIIQLRQLHGVPALSRAEGTALCLD